MNEIPPRELTLLRRLARLYGVHTSYRDMEKLTVNASPEGLLAILRALGAPIETPLDLERALDAKEREMWDWRLEPAFVAWEGILPEITLRLPARDARGVIEVELRLEESDCRAWQAQLESLDTVGTKEIGGERYVALRLPVGGEVPWGYHTLLSTAGQRRFESLVIATATRTYSGPISRTWGPFLPLYALHSKRSWGVGDLTDMRGLVEWAARRGATFLGTLPLLASFLEEPFDPSPYAPVSRLFWNELFIDPEAIDTETGGASDDPLKVNRDIAREIDRMRDEELVPYREAMTLKRGVLEERARLCSSDLAFRAFLESNPRVRDYARFRATVEKLGANWRGWPEPAQSGQLEPADYESDVADYHAFAQWQAGKQMQSLAEHSKEHGVDLYLDLPVGVHPDGYDAWRFQDIFVEGASVGAPPDVVTTSGQDWGFRPIHPQKLRTSRYEYVRAYLDHHMSTAGLMRIDHAMGIHRLYWVPSGAGARNGVYVRYNPDEMYAVLSLESHRHKAGIVGEDLGIVPEEVKKGVREHSIARMYVLSIELRDDPKQPFRPIPRRSVASFGTHDLPPFAAYWKGTDLEERQRLGVLDPERAKLEQPDRVRQKESLIAYLRRRGLLPPDDQEAADVLKACLALLASSASERVLVNLEDLWLEEQFQNVPGTMGEQHPNWRRRARYGLEELDHLPQVEEILWAVQERRTKRDVIVTEEVTP